MENSRYKLEKVENLGMKISTNEEKNIIKVYYVRKKFNIKLQQTIDKIILNSKEKQIQNSIHKLELPKKQKANNIQIYYKIKISNNSEVEGNTEIYEYIPNGYIATLAENQEWNINENIAIKKVDNIQIGESREYSIMLKNKEQNNIPIAINNTVAQNSTNNLQIEESILEDNSQITKCIIATSTGITGINKTIIYIILFTLINIALILEILRHRKKS